MTGPPDATPGTPAHEPEIGLEERADILWLAERLASVTGERGGLLETADPDGSGAATDLVAPDRSVDPGSAGGGRQPERYATDPPASVEQPTDDELHLTPPQRPGAPGTGRAAALIRIPRPPALPHSLHLAQALRPLSRRVPSISAVELDEEATIRRQVDEDLLLPVLRPQPARWLDLALVVDAGPSMHFWHDEVAELQQLMLQLGAFRDVRPWRLRPCPAAADGVELFAPADRTSAGRDPRELIDPGGRRVILHVTDGTGPLWRGGSSYAVLRRWCRHQPVAVLSVLPRRLWRRTALQAVRRSVRAPRAAAPNTLYRCAPDTGHPIVPLLELTPASLGSWARLVAQGNRNLVLDILRPPPRARDTPPRSPRVIGAAGGAEPSTQPARELVKRFRANASPTAWRLAGYLSAVPLTLPIMRLVGHTMTSDTTTGHLAEVLLGGLIRRVEPAGRPFDDETEYDFLPGVRAILLSGQFRDDVARMRELHESIGAQVRRHAGTLREFTAARTGAAEGTVAVPAASMPFAVLTDPAPTTSQPELAAAALVGRDEPTPVVRAAEVEPPTRPERAPQATGRTLRLRQSSISDGRHRVTLRLEDYATRMEVVTEFPFAVSEADAEDIRWYLEDFLEYPLDPAPTIAARVERRLVELGWELFTSVFDLTRDAREVWAAVRDRLGEIRIEIDADVGGTILPWELLRDPRTDTPVALQVDSFVRVNRRPAVPFPLPEFRLPDGGSDRLRVLMVICRPAAGADVPFRSVARHLTEPDAADPQPLQLDVLRPPTFAQLVRVLEAARRARRPYHVVHFDGHGVYLDAAELAEDVRNYTPLRYAPAQAPTRPGRRGYLVFENPDQANNEQLVDGPTLGGLLVRTGVPVLLLNTCRSAYAEAPTAPLRADADAGADGAHSETRAYGSLALEATDAGLPGVVAMRYNVFVVTAAHFAADLYAALLSGRSLGAAVTAGRRQLAAQPNRTIAFDPVPLQDWSVPVVYEATPLTLFRTAAPPHRITVDREQRPRGGLDGLPRRPDVGFFGRDETLLALDRAFDRHRIVLLHAYAGSGKTSTAAEFARWYASTGGLTGADPDIEGLVLFSSLEQHTPLPRLLNQLAEVFGPLLAANSVHWQALDDGQRRALAIQLLALVPVLWIWDNVEPVRGFPGGTPSAWTAEEQVALSEFLSDIVDTKARVLLTSRRDERDWLGGLPVRVALPAMPMRERIQLTRAIAERQGHQLSEVEDWRPLLRYTAGNPLTITVLVGQALREGLTRREQIEEFVARLRAGEAGFDDDEAQGRYRSLGASLGYGLAAGFTEAERAQLAVLHLFQDAVDVDALVFMGDPGSGRGLPELAGFTRADGIALLDRAAGIGLLSALGGGWYSIHPALSWYFRWLRGGPAASDRAESAYTAAIAGLGRFYERQYDDGRNEVTGPLRIEEANLLHARSLARRAGRWDDVMGCMAGLGVLYEHLGRHAEWARLVQELVPDLVDPEIGGPYEGLDEPWELLTRDRIGIARDQRDWATAELLQDAVLSRDRERAAEALATEPDQLTEGHRRRIRALAASEFSLGHILREQQRPDCVAHYERAADLSRRIGARREEGVALFSLGLTFLDIPALRDLDRAEYWFRRRVDLMEEHDRLGLSRTTMQLGRVAYERFHHARDAGEPAPVLIGHLNHAADAFHQALNTLPPDAVGDQANVHNQLGAIYSTSGDYETALSHYQRSIRYTEDAGDRYAAGQARFNAAVALARAGRNDDARLFARAALRDFEPYGAGASEAADATRSLLSQLDEFAGRSGPALAPDDRIGQS